MEYKTFICKDPCHHVQGHPCKVVSACEDDENRIKLVPLNCPWTGVPKDFKEIEDSC